MASRPKSLTQTQKDVDSEVFDLAHLSRYTMSCADLEREIVQLFLVQLPETIGMIRQTADRQAWRLATHSLKGSAASVGARQINRLAAELESLDFDADPKSRARLVAALDVAIAEFQAVALSLYPSS